MADNEEITFESLVAEKRHKELLELLRGVGQKEDSELKAIILGNTELVSKFVTMMSNFKFPEQKELPSPQVNVNTNNEEILKAFTDMGNTLNESLKEVKKCLEEREVFSEWTFTKNYNYGGSGSWQSITAKGKK